MIKTEAKEKQSCHFTLSRQDRRERLMSFSKLSYYALLRNNNGSAFAYDRDKKINVNAQSSRGTVRLGRLELWCAQTQ